MSLDLLKARSAISALSEAFFSVDHQRLHGEFQLSDDLIEEGVDGLQDYLGEAAYARFAPPPAQSLISLEENSEDEGIPDAPLRIYRQNTGEWGYEMDLWLDGQRSDLCMRGCLSADFNTADGRVYFHLFEVM